MTVPVVHSIPCFGDLISKKFILCPNSSESVGNFADFELGIGDTEGSLAFILR
jgi:hypothetical protein